MYLMSVVHVAHIVLVFSSMRVYAMCDRSRLLAALVGILSMVPVATIAVRLRFRICSDDDGLINSLSVANSEGIASVLNLRPPRLWGRC